MLATFIHTENAAPNMAEEISGWTYPGCTTFAPEQVQALAGMAGLRARDLPWYHPRQTWYALALTPEALPDPAHDRHLSRAVLHDPRFSASLNGAPSGQG